MADGSVRAAGGVEVIGLDGLQAVQARIARIEQRIAGFQPPAAARTDGRFSAVLADAVASAAGVRSAAGVAHPHPGIPPDLAAYGNGRIPVDAMTPIGRDGHRLWGPAAAAFERMAADAASAGVDVVVTDSYRSLDAQVDVARRKGLYRNGGLAAEPGTSDHGWGLSIDVNTSPAALGWLRRNAGQYGFVEDVPREPWHWTYQGR